MDEINKQQALAPGTVLDSGKNRYTIVKVLGSGSFGITYLAISLITNGNISHQVKVAIKEHFMSSCYRDSSGTQVLCTPTSTSEVEQSRKDFVTEAKRLQKICTHSKNIVHVNETFLANGTAYYVMEYLDGGNPAKMSESEALKLTKELAQAIDILHKDKLLHLDIKPDNIVMKTEPDGSIHPVLIDFGITKHFDHSGNPTSRVQAKGASSGYAPVEQYDAIKEFAPTYDIYALGAVLFYLLTGQNPPDAFKLLSNPHLIDSLLPDSVSASTATAIKKAMEPNRSQRTQNIAEFINNLDDACGTSDVNNCGDGGGTSTQILGGSDNSPKNSSILQGFHKKLNWNIKIKWNIKAIIAASLCLLCVVFAFLWNRDNSEDDQILTIGGHQYVDLELPSGLKWATCNVGAHSPEESGDHFAWGETETKSSYRFEKSETYNKNNDWLLSNGYISQSGNLTMAHDAARQNWGGSWRMPTEAEIQELMDNTTSKWTTRNGVKGRLFTSKKNKKSIFLPAGGYYSGEAFLYDDYLGYYWLSTAIDNTNEVMNGAYSLYFSEDVYRTNSCYRHTGKNIRPVSE